MLVTFFDVGAYDGTISNLIIDLCKELDLDYRVYQFEPSKSMNWVLQKRFEEDPKVSHIPVALTDKKGKFPLYHTKNDDGYSLHESKWNVIPNAMELVDCEKFSEWYRDNILFKGVDDFFLMNVDINGSEYEFFNDLIGADLHKSIDLFCGKIFTNLEKLNSISPAEQKDFAYYLLANGITDLKLTKKDTESLVEIKDVLKSWKEERLSSPKQEDDYPKEIPGIPIITAMEDLEKESHGPDATKEAEKAPTVKKGPRTRKKVKEFFKL